MTHLINRLLSPLNLAVTRKSSLDSLRAESHFFRSDINKFLSGDHLSGAHRELVRHQIAQKWSLVDHFERITAHHDTQVRHCPLCHHQGRDQDFEKKRTHCMFGGGTLLRHVCPSCEVIFGPDKMLQLTDSELSQEYEWHYKVYEEGDSTDQELRAFRSLKPFRGGVYINYGAGTWSRSVQLLRSEGWDVWAYEPHSSAIGSSDGVICDPEQLHAMKFDGIYSNNVLEHFRYPQKELEKMARLLKPHGLMAHATPCYEYLYEYTRFHLFFFPEKSRQILLQRAGLTEIEFIRDRDFMCSIMKNSS